MEFQVSVLERDELMLIHQSLHRFPFSCMLTRPSQVAECLFITTSWEFRLKPDLLRALNLTFEFPVHDASFF